MRNQIAIFTTTIVKTWWIFSTLIFATCILANAQTPNASSTNTNTISPKKIMNFTLTNEQNHKVITNPTDADIRGMMASLTDDFGPVLTLQTAGDAQYLSMDEIAKGKFGFTCKEGNIAWTTKDGHECSTEEAIKIIISYRDQTPDWKKLGEWKQVPALSFQV